MGFNLGTSFRNTRAFSVVMEDETIQTWGWQSHGGTQQPSGVSNVKTVFSTYRAFCALHNDKTVTVWGDKACGGDDTKAKKLSNVAAIYTAKCAFAAVLENGDVVSWGTLEDNKVITEPP